jgi:uncharacterized membrane protein YesL
MMNILDTRVYRWAQTATDFFLLNLMWLLACLPVVTALPATAAMFGVVRDWAREKEAGVIAAFVLRFRQNFVQSLVVGVRSLLVLAGVLYASASVFLFPVMVHYDTRWTAVPKNALLLSIARLPTTLLCLLTVAAMAALTFIVPALILITGSLTANAVYKLCDREFRKIDGF